MTTKVKRPLKFKLDSLRFYLEGNSAKQAFVLAGKLNECTLSGCMTDYASSYMSDDIKNFLKKKYEAGDSEVYSYFNKHGIRIDEL